MSYKKRLEEITQREQRLQEEKRTLLAVRKTEIFSLFEKTQTIDIDDDLVLGALLTIQEAIANNTNQELLTQFRAKAADTFRRKPKKQEAA